MFMVTVKNRSIFLKPILLVFITSINIYVNDLEEIITNYIATDDDIITYYIGNIYIYIIFKYHDIFSD